MTRGDWTGIADLIERSAADPGLIADVVAEVRSTSREIAALQAADVARHTRALLAAATRAIAARRAPTLAELSFVEDLAITRAHQGVPVHAVLSAIHVAERRIWAHAKAAALELGLDAALVLEARELYDDWAQAVRERLIVAHRSAESEMSRGAGDRHDRLLSRLLQGGAAAMLAAHEAGLGSDALFVAVIPGDSGSPAAADGMPRAATAAAFRPRAPAVTGVDAGELICVSRHPPTLRPGMTHSLDPAPPAAHGEGPGGVVIGIAGPGGAESLPRLRRLAAGAARAGRARGRSGAVHVTDVAGIVALFDRPDLADLLVERHGPALDALGRQAVPTVTAVQAWIECARDAEASAVRLFVHPNTVRNRLAAFTAATGLDLTDPLGVVDVWWLCRSWLNLRSDPGVSDGPA